MQRGESWNTAKDTEQFGEKMNNEVEEEIDTDDSFNEEEVHEIDVWQVIDEETHQYDDGDLLEIVKRNIKFCRAFNRDKTIRAIKESLNQAKTHDYMDFQEAMDYAVDKRTFLIQRMWKEWKAENDEAEMEEETSEQQNIFYM